MNNNKNKFIPELRFPEFANEQGWKINSIDDLCNVLNNFRKPISGSERKKGKYPYYGASGIIDYVDDYIFDKRLLLVGEDGAKWNAFENTAFIVEGKYWVNNHAHVLKPIKINDKLLESYLVKLDIQPYITGAAPPKLTLGKLKEIPIPVPQNPNEQKKIATFLSSLDDVLTSHSQKLELLKEHKKGLMQNLFPQEGETKPHWRFREFEESWKRTKLISHIDLISGFAFQSQFFSEKGKKLITPKNFTKNGCADFNFENTKYTTEDFDRKYICGENDLLLLLTDLTPSCELLGKPVLLKKEDGEVLLNQRIVKILFKENFNRNFLLQFFLTDLFHKRIINTASGSTVHHSSNKIILDTELFYPPNPKEQQKIAECLSTLDTLIATQLDKIKQLKLHKKGLLQGLFPKVI